MTIYVSRFRRAYLRKRSIKEMTVFTFGFIAFVLLLGRIGYIEEQDRQPTEKVTLAEVAR